MAAWVAFGALALGLIAVLLLLSIASARAVERTASIADRTTALERSERRSAVDADTDRHVPGGDVDTDPRLPRFEPPAERAATLDDTDRADAGDGHEIREMSTAELLANVALTQGLFGAVMVAGAAYFAIPFSALGVGTPLITLDALALGLGAGLLLWFGNEVAASVADAAGVGYDESVRSMLTPDSATGWIVLLGLILPTIALVEELLFRGVAIGALAAGFDVPVWLLVVASSLAFGGAHGAQGRVGAAVATALGLVLGAVFAFTGSLLVVVVAHYLVNALEFVVHEGLEVSRPLAAVSATLPDE